MKWEKLSEDEYSIKVENRVFLLRREDVGTWGIGKCFNLETKLTTESEFKYVTQIVYSEDNHNLKPHEDLRKIFTKEAYFDSRNPEHMIYIFNIAEKYIDKLF